MSAEGLQIIFHLRAIPALTHTPPHFLTNLTVRVCLSRFWRILPVDAKPGRICRSGLLCLRPLGYRCRFPVDATFRDIHIPRLFGFDLFRRIHRFLLHLSSFFIPFFTSLRLAPSWQFAAVVSWQGFFASSVHSVLEALCHFPPET